jgi:hypothetical protein
VNTAEMLSTFATASHWDQQAVELVFLMLMSIIGIGSTDSGRASGASALTSRGCGFQHWLPWCSSCLRFCRPFLPSVLMYILTTQASLPQNNTFFGNSSKWPNHGFLRA